MRRCRKKRGFTLTEVAIVLGIIGLMLGAIWGAAATVYQVKKTTDLLRQIVITAQNFRTFYATAQSPGASSQLNAQQNFNAMNTMTDSDTCSGVPCSTSTMLAAGILPADFIQPNAVGSDGAQGNLYVTTEGWPVWTGTYDCALYVEQQNAADNTNIAPPCSGKTVVELDFFNLTQAACTSLLMNIINANVDNLMDVSTPTNGWGPVVGLFYGNPTLPTQMSVATAATACAGGTSYFTYSTDNSQLWLVFSN